jgi:hypothetical protein
MIDSEVLLPKLWAAAETNKARVAGRCARQGDHEQYANSIRGKWLAFTEVALYLDGAFDPKVSDLQDSR